MSDTLVERLKKAAADGGCEDAMDWLLHLEAASRIEELERGLENIDKALSIPREAFVLQGPAFIVKRAEQVRLIASSLLSGEKGE